MVIQHKLSIGLAVGGIVTLIVVGIVGWIAAPKIIENRIKQETRLEEGNLIWDKWVDIPIPITLSFYFSNITNADAVNDALENGRDYVKPHMEEAGPYVYRQRRVKTNITFDDEHDTVKYIQTISYTFDEEASWPRTEDDRINMVNMPLVCIATVLRTLKQIPLFIQTILANFMVNMGEKLITKDVRIGDVTFKGVNASHYDGLVALAEMIGIRMPAEMQGGKWGVYLNKNNSHDGLYEVYRGRRDSSKFATIRTVNGNSHLPFWKQDWCNKINGTDGIMFPPFVKKDSVLHVYIPDVCRALHIIFRKEVEFEGIPAYRFIADPNIYTTPYVEPENWCYCITPGEPLNDTCDASGGGRLLSCKSGAPIIAGKPHLLHADDVVTEFIDGLKPDDKKHDTFIDIEPNTGFPIRAHKRLGAGLEIQTLPGFPPPFDRLPYTGIPMFWADEEGTLDKELVDELHSRMVTPMKAVNIGKWVGVGVGIALVLGSVATFFVFKK